MTNNGGIRANLRAGPATYGSLFEIQPFGNSLYRLTVPGKALRDYFERLVARRPGVHISGATITYDSTKSVGTRLVSARLAGGRDIADNALYTIVMNDFLALGGEGLGLASRATRTEILPVTDLDAFVDYLKAQPQPVRAPADPRISAAAVAP